MAKLARDKERVQETGVYRKIKKFINEAGQGGYSRPKDDHSKSANPEGKGDREVFVKRKIPAQFKGK